MQFQRHRDTSIALRLTEQKHIHPRPSGVRELQQPLGEIAHKEPRDRSLRTLHHDLDPSEREGEGVLGRHFSPFAAGLGGNGSVEVRERPGGRFCTEFSYVSDVIETKICKDIRQV